MNEAETRAEHIDPALKAAGWGVVEGSRIRREYPIAPGRIEGLGWRGKPLTADYVLEYRNTKLAVIEAKAWNEEVTEGVGQAKNYAGKLAVRFSYATNGRGIYGIDMASGAEGEVPKNGSIFFTIFQTFMSGPFANTVRAEPVEALRQAQGERSFYFGEYPPDFFDFIVIDER